MMLLQQAGSEPSLTLAIPGTDWHFHVTGAPALLIALLVVLSAVAFVLRFFLLRRHNRAAREKLRVAENYLQAMFAAMEEVVQVIDRDGIYQHVPATRAQRQFGSSNDIAGKSVNEVLPVEVATLVVAVNLHAIESKESISTEFSVVGVDGTVRYSATVSALNERSALWVVRNVTRQWDDRNALAEREGQYRLLFESNPSAMWVYDFDTAEILDVNDSAIAQYGYSRSEFRKMTLRDLRDAADVPDLQYRLRAVHYDWMAVDQVRHRRKDGTYIDVEVRGSPIHVGGRKAQLVVVADVTDRLLAEARVREASMLTQRVIDTAPQAIVVTDAQWRVTRWNKAAEDLFGWSATEVIGHPAPCVPPDERERFVENPAHDPAGNSRHTVEIKVERKDATSVYVLLAMAALHDANSSVTGYVAVITDLTERIMLDEQQRHSQKMEAIGRLAGGIAHDFNNMLTVISSYAYLLLDNAQDPAIRSDLEEIRLATQRATALTRQLLTFSRRDVVSLHSMNVSEIAASMESMLKRLLNADINVVSKLRTDLGLITADSSQIEQVIMNLVLNASDAMAHGGTLVLETDNTELDEAYARKHSDVVPGQYVMLAVTDTGAGMDAMTVSRAFEPFFTTKGQGRGTGLGLATVYAIVKQLDGHVWIYSELGHGTTFKIYLPRTEVAKPVTEEMTVFTRRPQPGTETVLLVEDDDSVRRVVKRMLEQLSYTVLEAVNGAEALGVIASCSGTIHLVVTDLMMPTMNGRELADALAVTNPGLNVLFTSGYTDDVAIRRGMMESAHAFLQKPFTAEQLTRSIAAFYPQ